MASNKTDKIISHSEVSEKSIERYLVDRVKAKGGICLKYSNPGLAGYPDRVCLLPHGVTMWFELKSKGEKLRSIQSIRIAHMRNKGHLVFVCDSKAEVDNALDLYGKV